MMRLETEPEPQLIAEEPGLLRWTTPGGIPVEFRMPGFSADSETSDARQLQLHWEHARLKLLRGFDQLLCLEGLQGVEHLPHQIETVRKVLRHFRGRVLLADEVGLGKTIEACLLLREYLLRALVRRVLILVPAPLVSQWQGELQEKFQLDFSAASRGVADDPEYWQNTDRVLASLSFVKGAKRAPLVTQVPWDLVIVDEAHHCKNRSTRNWQLVNALQRRHMFLLTATPVQNNLVELYNLLTLLEPGHLKTETDFKRQYVKRGNPRDPRNRERLRALLGEVMVRNTRSLVQMNLPPRYAQTLVARPGEEELRLYAALDAFLVTQRGESPATGPDENSSDDLSATQAETHANDTPTLFDNSPDEPETAGETADKTDLAATSTGRRMTRMQLAALLAARGSHPQAVAQALERMAASDPRAAEILKLAAGIPRSGKDDKLLELVRQSDGNKLLVFVNFRKTLTRLQELLSSQGIAFSTFSGEQTAAQKDQAVEAFRDTVPVMLCTDSGGEGRNLQFANTLVNYDLPWNPMKIEQRIGRVHRIGQSRDVFVFNLCTADSLESRILTLLDEKIRMFELVVGEVGSILGNLQGGEEFESLVLNLWVRSHNDQELDQSFENLGNALLEAQDSYVQSKELDEALFGDDYE